jgi:hypothetical protein
MNLFFSLSLCLCLSVYDCLFVSFAVQHSLDYYSYMHVCPLSSILSYSCLSFPDSAFDSLCVSAVKYFHDEQFVVRIA